MFHYLAERRIQEAMARGEFRNLPGEGKPLDLNENPFEAPEMRMAMNLLENNGFKLPWIEKLNEIRKEIEVFRRALCSEKSSGLLQDPAYQEKSRQRMAQINKKIMDYNISVPIEQLQIMCLNDDISHADD